MAQPPGRAPRLSVIIPFYDETAFVAMAVGSVFAQGIAGAEVILVNDNPDTFDADAIAALALPAAVRVVHMPANGGLSAARNAGIAAAAGRYIGFLDSDDYYVADALAAHLAEAETTGADICHAQTWVTRIGSPQPAILPRDAALFAERKVRGGLRDCENAQFITSSWSSLYRADFLRAAGLRFDAEQRKFEDRLFVLQAVTAAGRIAQFGRPVRVWRRRAGSISTSVTDPAIHLLQVQLLEKCLGHMRAWSAARGAPQRFAKRELFNTLSRLIWDMDLLPHLAAPSDPVHAALRPRVAALFADDRLGQDIFSDRLVQAISRVGQKTRRGVVSRGAFFDIQRALRDGDFAAATAALAGSAAGTAAPRRAAPDGVRLVLHLGMHKTGSTALQQGLMAQQARLVRHWVLFPRTGLPADHRPVRDGGLPGHQDLLSAIRRGSADDIWKRLADEVRRSACRTVILSCENFLMPLSDDRDMVLPQLLDRLSAFAEIQPVAFVRRPDVALDRLYREVVAGGSRMGARSFDEFRLDFGPLLADLPGLFAPFERLAGRPVRLVDYDAAVAGPGLRAAFAAAAGIDLPPGDGLPQVYPTPPAAHVAAARVINSLLTSQDRRETALRDFFRSAPPVPDAPLAPPQVALAQVAAFRAQSGDWAAARGYAPDWTAIEAAAAAAPLPPETLPPAVQEAILRSCLRSEAGPPATGPAAGPAAPPAQRPARLRLRLRPWAVRALERFAR